MSDLIGGLFSVLWFLFIIGMIKKAANANKKNGKKSSGTGFLMSQMKAVKKDIQESFEIDEEEAPDFEEAHPVREIRISSGSKVSAGRKARIVITDRPRPEAGEARPAKAALRETSALSELMVEDRQHDWLARQIREEKKHVVWNNFVDLGAAHDEACAAELNRLEHKKQHQSYVVDDGITNN